MGGFYRCGAKINPGLSCDIISQQQGIFYDPHIKQILSSCSFCHNSEKITIKGVPAVLDYSTYDHAKKHALDGLRCLTVGSMPPANNISLQENAKAYYKEACQLQTWITQDYPP